jgi:hypothetical protein
MALGTSAGHGISKRQIILIVLRLNKWPFIHTIALALDPTWVAPPYDIFFLCLKAVVSMVVFGNELDVELLLNSVSYGSVRCR